MPSIEDRRAAKEVEIAQRLRALPDCILCDFLVDILDVVASATHPIDSLVRANSIVKVSNRIIVGTDMGKAN
jgi:hypothetical protein